MVNVFTLSERRVIASLFKLNRWATANEIAIWADNMSWNTAKKTLIRLHRRKIVKMKLINRKRHWIMKNF